MTSSPGSRDPQRQAARLFGAPEPVNFRDTTEGRALAASAEIHFSARQDQDRLLAIEKLALDIFNDPLAARAFVVNPQEYLRRSGFEDIELDVASPEVRLAMALGDPEVKQAALNNDVDGFLAALREQGLAAETDPSVMAAFVTFEIGAVLSAVAWTWVAALHSVAAAMMVETYAALHSQVTVEGLAPLGRNEHLRIIQGLAAELGDSRFVAAVGDRIVQNIYEQYAELHASAADILAPVLPAEEVQALRETGEIRRRRRQTSE